MKLKEYPVDKQRRNLYIILAVLLLLLLTGVVYAATAGILNFAGTSRFSSSVKLVIVDEAVVAPETGDSAAVNAAGDTLTFSVLMTEWGATRQVKFKIENVGNVDATLGAFTPTGPTADAGVTVTWPDLNGVLIAAGDTSAEYTISVYWEPAYAHVTQNAVFSAKLNYSQASS
ncbi:MAG: hypothetical protein FWE69_01540 [Clostridiales bacterium]|nr:hypothetical protein [Clostridiales bacterium]